MAKNPQVPKFGNWDENEEVQYTAYFERASKGKKGSKMNPNDPQDLEAEVKGQNGRDETYPSPQRNNVKSGGYKSESETIPTRDERRPSREEGYMRRPTDSPLRNENNTGRRTSMDQSPLHRHGGGATPKRVASHQSAGPDRSIEHSPLHPHSRLGGKGKGGGGGGGGGVSSPSWERKASSEGSQGLAPSTPSRSRLRPVSKGDDMSDDGPAVPKFGDWDENDPASAEGFTQIFNKVQEEKQTGAAKVPVTSSDTSYSNSQKRYGNDSAKGCLCFPWGRS